MTQPTPNVTLSHEATHTPDQPNQPGAAPDANPDRDEQGRFKAGNRAGRGNPFARKTAALRSALINAVTGNSGNLQLLQTAIGGAGGESYGGTAGHGGAANSQLAFSQTTAGTTYAKSTAVGGAGGTAAG